MSDSDIVKLKPLKGKILGRVLGGDYTTDSGLLVVQSLKTKKPRKVLVIAVGDSLVDEKGRTVDCFVRPGNIAHFKLGEGEKFRGEKHTYLVLEFKDLVAIELI